MNNQEIFVDSVHADDDEMVGEEEEIVEDSVHYDDDEMVGEDSLVVPDVSQTSEPEKPLPSDFDAEDLLAKYQISDPQSAVLCGPSGKTHMVLTLQGWKVSFSRASEESSEKAKRKRQQEREAKRQSNPNYKPRKPSEKKVSSAPKKVVLHGRCSAHRSASCDFRCIYEEHYNDGKVCIVIRQATKKESRQHTCESPEEKIIAGGDVVAVKDIRDEMTDEFKKRAITCGGIVTAETLANEVLDYFQEKFKEGETTDCV
jgi:hypothetical protein